MSSAIASEYDLRSIFTFWYINNAFANILNCLNNIKLKKHLDADSATIILWKLPKSMASYVKILLKEFYTELKKEIMECYRGLSIDDTTADQILTYKEGSDYQYDE